MPSAETLALFFITDLFICLTPGPVVMAVTAQQLTGDTRGTLGVMAGVHTGNFVWYALVAFGLVTMIEAAPEAFAVLRWAGLAFLVYLGLRALTGGGGGFVSRKGVRRGFAKGAAVGLAIHMANPKALLFYTAVLPPFIDSARPALPQIIGLALVTVVTESIGMTTYAVMAWRATKLEIASGKLRIIERLSGMLLLGAAGILGWGSL